MRRDRPGRKGSTLSRGGAATQLCLGTARRFASMPDVRILAPGDDAALEAFLARHADTAMFLRSNARAAGLADAGQPFQATYAAAWERGDIIAVAAHCWNGVVLVQAPVHVAAVVRAAVERSGRPVRGIAGPHRQVVAARAALGLTHTPAAKDSREVLFALALNGLVVPQPLAAGLVRCRRPREDELDLLVEWRAAYCVEALGASDGPELRRSCRSDVTRQIETEAGWMLLAEERPVAYSAFNARLPDMVQVGGVWTPPALRGRGYGRAVVAGSLREAREQGVARATLFTEERNVAAQAAYRALGFRVVGDYGLVLFADAPPSA